MKKKVLAICGFNNTAHIFLEIASLYQQDWDIELLLLFEDKDLAQFLAEKGIPFTIRPVPRIKSLPKRLLADYTGNKVWARRYVKVLRERGPVDVVFNFDNYVWGLGKWVNKQLNNQGALSLRYAWAVYTEESKNSRLSALTRMYLIFCGFRIRGQFQLQSATHYTLCRSTAALRVIGGFGIPLKKLKAVGSHQLELLDQLKAVETVQKGVLIISQPVDYNVFIPELKKLVELLIWHNERPTIKLHPRDDDNEFNWFFEHEDVTVLKHSIYVPTSELIRKSAYIITYGSTVAFDSLYLEKNTVFYDFGLPVPSSIQVFKEVAQPLLQLDHDRLKQAIEEKGVHNALRTSQKLNDEGVKFYMGEKRFRKKLDEIIDGS